MCSDRDTVTPSTCQRVPSVVDSMLTIGQAGYSLLTLPHYLKKKQLMVIAELTAST